MTRTATAKPVPGATTTSTKERAASVKKAAPPGPAVAKKASARRADPARRPAPLESAAKAAPDVGSATATQINFRADPETKAALDELTADGTAVSEVIRKAIQDARRAARRAKAVAEMEAIMADPEQRLLSADVYRDMSNLSAW